MCILGGVWVDDSHGRQCSGRQAKICKLGDLQCRLVLDRNRQPTERLVKVVGPLHDKCGFRIVDVVRLQAGGMEERACTRGRTGLRMLDMTL
jgi:hypothetical protein